MPLLKYFGSVGTALLLLLFGLNWLVPQSAEGPVRSGVDRTVIRISSIERLPEPVVIDTSLPTIVPPPTSIEPLERPLLASVETNLQPRKAVSTQDVSDSGKPRLTKPEPLKKAVSHRRPAVEPAQPRSVEAAAPVTRMSLLDILKERLGQSLKIN
jgi:hypothetical protein